MCVTISPSLSLCLSLSYHFSIRVWEGWAFLLTWPIKAPPSFLPSADSTRQVSEVIHKCFTMPLLVLRLLGHRDSCWKKFFFPFGLLSEFKSLLEKQSLSIWHFTILYTQIRFYIKLTAHNLDRVSTVAKWSRFKSQEAYHTGFLENSLVLWLIALLSACLGFLSSVQSSFFPGMGLSNWFLK